MKVLFLASEAFPFVKVGGLADVAGSLPGAINDLEDAADLGLILIFVFAFHFINALMPHNLI